MKNNLNIIEVAMEIALTPEILNKIEENAGLYAAIRTAMSTSVGGIGPLLRERIITQADLEHNIIGISLLYDRVWLQRWHSWGQFYLESNDAARYLRPQLEEINEKLNIKLPDGKDVEITVWKAVYKKAAVYFLDAPEITNIVYPGPEDAPADIADPNDWSNRKRMEQSWILGRGSLKLLKKLNIKPDIIALSETPTIFSIHKLVSDPFGDDELFKDTKYIFNDHTPLEYAHPVWSENHLKYLKIKPEHYKNLESYKIDTQKIDITQLLINICDSTYGVSLRHGEVMRNMSTLKPYAKEIKTITNGVSRDIWQADVFSSPESLTDIKLLSVKKKEKERLIDWMWLRFKFSSQWRDKMKKRPLVFWMRRVTAYKRLDVLKEIIARQDLRERFVKLNLAILLGGRIHQADMHSDRLVFDLLDLIQKYNKIEDSLILLDNFNIWEAPRLYRGIDAAVMISNAGREAAATGFMKAQLNGAAVIATDDGAIPESVFYYKRSPGKTDFNGFLVEYFNGCPTPESLLKAFEEFHEVYHNKQLRIKMIRSALSQAGQVDVLRTTKEMIELYRNTIKKTISH